uniref:NADH-ubiquinone oxidoreductase chain 4 n=1 Tax=Dinophilus gyrociliatus TaxID=120995 RepID=A0A343TAQ8_9ANNE|nr:NADH dehydrogenase subunit 4 [Dinophilus gyrociliatus]
MLKIIMLALLPLLPNISKSPFTLIILMMLMTPMVAMNMFSNYTSNMFFMDNMSFTLIILNLWITALMIMASLKITKSKNSSLFIVTIMALLTSVTLAFSMKSPLTFYFTFEFTLIPTLFLILKWGYQPERLQAGSYFIIYTMTASLPLLLNILMTPIQSQEFSMIQTSLSPSINFWWSISLFMAFLAKAPMFFLHLWLPKAHVEAPVAGSMILAGILLKLGTFGMMRLAMTIPNLINSIKPLILAISLTGAAITSLICTRQQDMKSLIAYSSVAHMGMGLAGILSNSAWGWKASVVMMIAHGLSSSALFFMTSTAYEMSNSRALIINKGILMFAPAMSMMWFLIIATNMGAPPFLNLGAEIPLIASSLFMSLWTSLPLAILSFFTVMFNLMLYVSMNHGSPFLMTNSPLYNIKFISIPLIHFIPLLLLMPMLDYTTF